MKLCNNFTFLSNLQRRTLNCTISDVTLDSLLADLTNVGLSGWFSVELEWIKSPVPLSRNDRTVDHIPVHSIQTIVV